MRSSAGHRALYLAYGPEKSNLVRDMKSHWKQIVFDEQFLVSGSGATHPGLALNRPGFSAGMGRRFGSVVVRR